MIGFLFAIFIAALIITFIVLMWTHTEHFYNFNKKLKEENETLFKIIGSKSGSLDDKDKWIKESKAYFIFFALLIGILVVYVFGF